MLDILSLHVFLLGDFMKYLLTGKQMREADRYTIEQIGIPSLVLMERASLGVVDEIIKRFPNRQKVLVVCGAGNNGGDGYAIARLLYLKEYEVATYFVGNDDSRSDENRLQKQICDHYQIPEVNSLEEDEYTVIVDAIFGTGLSREVTGKYKDIIEELNQLSGYKVAVDIPSGIHDTTGLVMGTAFCANLTVAIAYMKRGIVLQPGNVFAGEIVTVDIGIYDESIPKDDPMMFTYEWEDLKNLYPKRKPNSHKGSYGKVGLVVGSKGMSGAAYLCAKAAYLSGAGLVQIYTHEDNRVILQKILPEAIIATYENFDEKQLSQLIDWSDVIGIGCGLGQSDLAKDILKYIIKNRKQPLVIDADGLNILAENRELLLIEGTQIILTPHMKEMSRLIACSVKEIQDSRAELLQVFVDKYPVTCVLKDARTLVAQKGSSLCLNMTGNSAMAKGGSGDVLTGIITATVAQHVDVFTGTALSVYLHGAAGDLAKEKHGAYSVLASDIVDAIGEILKQLD